MSGIYTDLMRKFRDEGHEVYIVFPFERRSGRKTELLHENGVHILGVRGKNGADCYSKNGHAVTDLTRQS